VAWLDPGPGGRWLDVGCGTGALTEAVLARTAPVSVMAIDPSEGFVRAAAERLRDPRVRFAVADASTLLRGPFDVVVSGLVLNFLPDPRAGLAAMRKRFHPAASPRPLIPAAAHRPTPENLRTVRQVLPRSAWRMVSELASYVEGQAETAWRRGRRHQYT